MKSKAPVPQQTLLFAVTVTLFCAGCNLNPGSNRTADTTRISFRLSAPPKDSSPLRTETRKVDDFSAIQVSGGCVVKVTCGKPVSVSVEANENSLAGVKTKVLFKTLDIYADPNAAPERVVVSVTAPTINSVNSGGTSNVSIMGLKGDKLVVTLSGASSLRAQGKVGSLVVSTFGSSRVAAQGLETNNCTITTVGTSAADVFTNGDLKAESSGASNVVVYGHPKNVIQQASAEAGSIDIY